MARWIFTQLKDSANSCAFRWVWVLEEDWGQVLKLSNGSFRDLAVCMHNATEYGYYGGHPAVYIRTNEGCDADVMG